MWTLESMSFPACIVQKGRKSEPRSCRYYPCGLLCVLGWEWSMMGKATGVGTRRPWAVSWRPWCKLLSIATTGPDAVARSWRDTSSMCLTACHALLHRLHTWHQRCWPKSFYNVIWWYKPWTLVLSQMGFHWGRFLVTDGQAWAEDGDRVLVWCLLWTLFIPWSPTVQMLGSALPPFILVHLVTWIQLPQVPYIPELCLIYLPGTSKDERQVE